MPYRRLPNTDNARLKALKSAFNLGEKLPPFQLAYSQTTLQKIRHFLPEFESNIITQKNAFDNQVKNNCDYINSAKKVRLYISHFFQVLNLAIIRGELNPSTRKFFDIKENDKKIPSLLTETDIIFWAKKIIAGEQERVSRGLNPITNPTFGLVSVRYEKFLEAHRYQKSLQSTNARSLGKVAGLRKEADEIILNIWNEVEQHFSALSENEKREKASSYGLVYVLRSSEKFGQNELFTDQTELVTEEEITADYELAETRQNLLSNSKEIKADEAESQDLQYSLFFRKDCK